MNEIEPLAECPRFVGIHDLEFEIGRDGGGLDGGKIDPNDLSAWMVVCDIDGPDSWERLVGGKFVSQRGK